MNAISLLEISPDYPALFKQMIVNSTQFILNEVQTNNLTLTPEYQEQALHTLRYSFKLAVSWSNTQQLLLSLAPQMEQTGYRTEWMPYLLQGIKQSQDFNDPLCEAELRFQLGILYQFRGHYYLAQEQFELSITLFFNLNSTFKQAQALNRLAYIARLQRNFKQAISLVNKARQLLAEDDIELAYSYLVLGTVALDDRDYPAAINFFKQSLTGWQASGNRRRMGWSLINMGVALEKVKDYLEATKVYKQAIVIFKEIKDPTHQSLAQMNLGNVYLAQDNFNQALELYLKAYKEFRQAQEPPRLALVTHNLGRVYRLLKQWDNAEKAYCLSLQYKEKIGNVVSLVNTLDGLGLVYLQQGDYLKAEQIFTQALERLQAISDEPSYAHWCAIVSQHLKQANMKASNLAPC